MVAIHAGGFKKGDRNKQPIVDQCRRLASRGYVCATIDYRLGIKQGLPAAEAMEEALYDARAAVRWLRKNAKQYRIDTGRIGAYGASAGAITVAAMTTFDGEGDSGNAGFSSAISAGVGLSGALPQAGLANVTSGQPPLYEFHGCNDNLVPYGPCQKGVPSCMSAVDTIAAMRAKGVAADLYTFPNAGHIPFDLLNAPPASDSMYGFLAEHLDLVGAECPRALRAQADTRAAKAE